MKKDKQVKKTRKQLERQILELESQLIHSFHFASSDLKGLTRKRLMGSGVLVQLSVCGGKKQLVPFMLKDGLSDELIKALKADMKYSYDLATQWKVIE